MKPTTPGNAAALFLLLPQLLGATLSGDAVPSVPIFIFLLPPAVAVPRCVPLSIPAGPLTTAQSQAKGAQPASPSPRYLSLASPLAGSSVSRLINSRHHALTAPGVQPPPAGEELAGSQARGARGKWKGCAGTLMFVQLCTDPSRPAPVREVPWAPCRLLRAHCNPTGLSHPKLG